MASDEKSDGAVAIGSEMERIQIMLKSASGLAAAGCVESALRAPGIFKFGKILNHPNIQKLKGTKHDGYVKVLELFAYGMYSQYDAKIHPKLDAKQMTKLKQLTIVSLASQSSSKVLGYDFLLKKLDIKTVRELEDMIINCIYGGLIVGRLNQERSELEIEYARGRDVNANDLNLMKAKLIGWLKHCDSMAHGLQARVKQANELTTDRARRYDRAQKIIEERTGHILERAQQEKMVSMAQ